MATCRECGETYPPGKGRSREAPGILNKTAEGVVVIEGERILHRCPTVSRAVLGEALRFAGEAMFNPPPGLAPEKPDPREGR